MKAERPREFVVLELPGQMPVKKNAYRRAKNGRMFRREDVATTVDGLAFIAKAKWGNRPPVEHPRMAFEFYSSTRSCDRDGMYTTALDILQAAGVLRNDNIKRCNGEVIIRPAVFDKTNPRTIVRLWF